MGARPGVSLPPWWSLHGSYTWLKVNVKPHPATAFPLDIEGDDPNHKVFLASSWDLGCNWEFDLQARYTDDVPEDEARHYFGLNARLGWQATNQLEFELIGTDLLDHYHQEAGDDVSLNQFSEIRRGIFGELTWRY